MNLTQPILHGITWKHVRCDHGSEGYHVIQYLSKLIFQQLGS